MATFASVKPSGRFAAIAALVLASAPSVFAQGASDSWNMSFYFNGTGALPVSQTSYSYQGGPADPALTLTMNGSGTMTAVDSGFNDGSYFVDSYFNTTGSVAMSGTIPAGASPFSPTLSATTTWTTAQNLLYSDGNPPLYSLYPPANGQEYDANPLQSQQVNFQYDPNTVLYFYFEGTGDQMFLGTDTQTISNGFYVDTFSGSQIIMPTFIGENDPPTIFTGDIIITTPGAPAAGVPDTMPAWTGALVLLGVCAAGAATRKARTV